MVNIQKAYFGLQCFWGAESTFAMLSGVLKTRVGYGGGSTPAPNYRNIGDHTEITEVVFDEEVTSYSALVDWFWDHCDPTKEYKKQYKSAILYVNAEQKKVAEDSLKKMQEKYGNIKLDTYVQELDQFFQAEDYHQKYWLRRNKEILNKLNLSDEDVVTSMLAAKVNAFLAGFKDFDLLQLLAARNNLDEDVVKAIEAIAISGGDTSACHI
ncbi:unnamed protein product [Thelazia callipaeda]|uniref:peptide-methionine (S)-S-oxide reductase n=1 Tax=Thelazia callipaeda TaxID=103827 RepID=A0A0N5CKQ0_THECL|nr:unnamed protein product [Thelazia callipaeda]